MSSPLSSSSGDSTTPSGPSKLAFFAMGAAAALGVSALKSLFTKGCTANTTCSNTGNPTAAIPTSRCPFSSGSSAPAATSAASNTSVSTKPISGSLPSSSSGSGSDSGAAAADRAASLVRPKRGKDPVHYHKYLHLDAVLNAQHPKSLEIGGVAAHDETLFIIVHQAHELWFKQIIHDLNSIRRLMSGTAVEDRAMGKVLERLTRITKIQRLLVDSLPVLETMTPLSFLEFREYLFPASGFQSMQFRQFEVLLGLRRTTRSCYAGAQYDCVLSAGQIDEIRALEAEPSLFYLLDKWLARTPLLRDGSFDFWEQYQSAVSTMFDEEKTDLQSQAAAGLITETTVTARLRDMETQKAFFARFFDPAAYEEGIAAGTYRLSYPACQAALMINFFQEEPIFQVPFQLLSLLIDIDQNLAAWRSKHASMVHRMLGVKMGTGGSSGYSYLLETVNQHRVFSELANIASLMVPRAYLPPLPEHVRAMASFSLSQMALSRANSSAASSSADGANADKKTAAAATAGEPVLTASTADSVQ